MSSPSRETEEPSSSTAPADEAAGASAGGAAAVVRPPAKRRLSSTVIEISDTESDDSDVCAVNSYQASADEVKRIRGEDYSSSSSSSDYSSDSEASWEDDSILVEDDKSQLKAVKTQLNPRANRMDDPQFNPKIKSQELIERLQTHWSEKKDLKSPEVSLTCAPFRLCLLHDFLANPEMINNMVDDMNTLDWTRKKMDLYEFHQTADLASLTWQRSIRGIYELLKTEVMSWVSGVTGLALRSVSASCSLYGPGDHLLPHDDLLADRRVAFILYLAPWRRPPDDQDKPLENGGGDHHEVSGVTGLALRSVSASCSLYGPGDHLLPHDDLLADRRVAFILYLAPWRRPPDDQDKPLENGGGDHHEAGAWGGWAGSMGGALQLLGRDARGRPTHVQHSVSPRNNMLAFFQVGVDSFHQVEEVLSLELPRLSINGWFHGPAPENEPPAEPEAEPEPAPAPTKPHADIVVLNQWVEATYMAPRARMQIQAQMERESEVCLAALLLPERLSELMQALEDPEVEWEAAGPANQRHYRRVSEAWLVRAPPQHAVRAAVALFSSAAFVRLLADCTDLALAGYSRLELQRWAPGDYSLLPPRHAYQRARLQALLQLGGQPRGGGGCTQFVAPEEAEAEGAALVSLAPAHNALALVYCDAGAAAFTKYVSRLAAAPQQRFYVLSATYHE